MIPLLHFNFFSCDGLRMVLEPHADLPSLLAPRYQGLDCISLLASKIDIDGNKAKASGVQMVVIGPNEAVNSGESA